MNCIPVLINFWTKNWFFRLSKVLKLSRIIRLILKKMWYSWPAYSVLSIYRDNKWNEDKKNFSNTCPSETTHQESTTCQHEYSNYSYGYSWNFMCIYTHSCTVKSTQMSSSLRTYWKTKPEVLIVVLILVHFKVCSKTFMH